MLLIVKIYEKEINQIFFAYLSKEVSLSLNELDKKERVKLMIFFSLSNAKIHFHT